jgi:hypothetical protein
MPLTERRVEKEKRSGTECNGKYRTGGDLQERTRADRRRDEGKGTDEIGGAGVEQKGRNGSDGMG